MADSIVSLPGTSRDASFTSSPMPSPILRNTTRSGFPLRLRPDRYQDGRPSSGSSSGSGSGASGSSGVSHGVTSSTGSVSSGGSMTRKRVQIMTDSPYDELPPYHIHRNSVYKVNFPGKTWDIMMQGFRIALEYDNVFVCDHFLGRDAAEMALTELRRIKETGQFERHMRRGQGDPGLKYACLYLLDQETCHRQLDTLVLMIYKLANYYCSEWEKISVELSYYPEGHRGQRFRKSEVRRKQLKCLYFPNNDWNLNPPAVDCEEGEAGEERGFPGTLTVENHNRKPHHVIEPVFDRLVVFWGDALDHHISECMDERFGLTVWMRR